MNQDLIVHRANSPVNQPTPLQQVEHYINAGFAKIEIDIYATSELEYKFCHPQDSSKETETHDLRDGFLEDLVVKHPGVEWFVDLKCLDLAEAPKSMMQHLSGVFGESAVFTAAQDEILNFMNSEGRRTAQYFKGDNSPSLSFEPTFYTLTSKDDFMYPIHKTIVYCPEATIGLDFLMRGFAGAMVDGELLLEAA